VYFEEAYVGRIAQRRCDRIRARLLLRRDDEAARFECKPNTGARLLMVVGNQDARGTGS
jgi:hypothetical protein